MDLQVSIIQVAVRNTNSGRQVFDVSCSDGKTRAVWDAGLANAINAFAGSGATVTIRVRVTQKGQYTNESINAFAPPGQTLPPEQAGSGPGGGFQGGGGGGGGKKGYPPEVETRITKLASYEYATTLVGHLFSGAGPEALAESIEATDQVAKHIYQRARSHEKANGAQQDGVTVLQPGGAAADQTQGGQVLQLPTATATPQGVAAGVPGVVVGTQALAPGGAADAQAAGDVTAQASAEQGDNIEWD